MQNRKNHVNIDLCLQPIFDPPKMSLYGCCGWRFLGPGWHLDSNSLSLTIDTVFVISRDDCWVKYPKTLCFENQCLENIPARGPQACLAHNYSNPVFVSTNYSQCIAMSTNERQTNKILVSVVKNLPWLRSTALPPLQWLTGGTFDWRRRRRRRRSGLPGPAEGALGPLPAAT